MDSGLRVASPDLWRRVIWSAAIGHLFRKFTQNSPVLTNSLGEVLARGEHQTRVTHLCDEDIRAAEKDRPPEDLSLVLEKRKDIGVKNVYLELLEANSQGPAWDERRLARYILLDKQNTRPGQDAACCWCGTDCGKAAGVIWTIKLWFLRGARTFIPREHSGKILENL